jgi:sn-glycerol 3-phosphate transport system substrate-binding protein
MVGIALHRLDQNEQRQAIGRNTMLKRLSLAFAMSVSATAAMAQTEIQWWHAMTGANNDVIVKLAEDFNASQKDYKVVPAYKGSYPDTLNAGIAAFRAGNAPHIMQVFEVGTATMMGAKGAVKPVQEMMKEAGESFEPSSYLPAITGYYSTVKGEMLSFPFNSSSAVMWYNKDAFKKAGLNADAPPKTWPDVFDAARKLKAAGWDKCGFSTAWITWVNIEQLGAWHNVPLGTKANGMDGFDTAFQINGDLHVKHLTNLVNLQKEGVFSYSGRTNTGEGRFTSGECPIFLTSSAFFGNVRCSWRTPKFDHRRCFTLGHGWQECRRVQRRLEVLYLPVGHGSSGETPHRIRLSANHQGCLCQGQGLRLLQGQAFP